jgi:hypothetical protein
MDQGGGTADRPPQGWFVDPFGVHEARWFSQGTPTGLVRDGRSERQDPPPDTTAPGPLIPARAAPAPSGPSDDLGRSDDRGAPSDPDPADDGGPVVGLRSRIPSGPPAPARLLRVRWIALGGAAVWSVLVVLELLAATTTVGTGGAHGAVRTETVYRSDRAGVLVFIGLLVVACAVAGIGLVRRIRSGSEAWSRSGLVCTGVIGVLGVASLANVGLSLVLLAALLFVVSRPLRRPPPLPGERLV